MNIDKSVLSVSWVMLIELKTELLRVAYFAINNHENYILEC